MSVHQIITQATSVTGQSVAALAAASMQWRDPAFAHARADWDRAIGELLIRESLMLAEQEFGELPRLQEVHDLALHNRASPADRETAWQAISRAEEWHLTDRLEPYWAAVRKVLQIPAPDPFAVRLKVALIIANDMGNDVEIDDAFQIIEDDSAALQAAWARAEA
jgi:hypothetical protein